VLVLSDPPDWQNLQLYSFGVVFNAARLLVDDVNVGFVHGFSLWPHVLLRGYDAAGGSLRAGTRPTCNLLLLLLRIIRALV